MRAPLGDPADCPVGALDSAAGVTDVTFWYDTGGVGADALQKLVDRFNIEHPKIHVEASLNGDLTKYLASLHGGESPDLYSDSVVDSQALVDSHSTVPFGACIESTKTDVSDFLPTELAVGTSNGELAAMPFGQGGQVLFYNKVAFRKAGLDPDKPPITFAEVRTDSEAIMTSGAAKHGISMERDGHVQELFAWAGQAFASAADGGPHATKLGIDSPFGIDLLNTIADMRRSGELIGFGQDPSPQALLAIANGDAAMTINGALNIGDVLAALNSGVGSGVELGIGPMPVLRDRVSSDLAGGKAMWLRDSGDPARTEAAFRFVMWLNEPQQLFEYDSVTGVVPPRTTAAALPGMKEFWSSHPEMKVAYDQILATPLRSDPTSRWIGSDAANSAFSELMSSILADGSDPATVIPAASKKAADALAAYNQLVAAAG
ncbi:MAG: extracellular solute-binding protein [Ilumatobacteraceae bacterium]